MTKMTKYIWWIGESKHSGIGSWESKEAAEKAIKTFIKINKRAKDWKPIKYETAICPTCGELKEKDIIKELGTCLNCDHIRSELVCY